MREKRWSAQLAAPIQPSRRPHDHFTPGEHVFLFIDRTGTWERAVVLAVAANTISLACNKSFYELGPHSYRVLTLKETAYLCAHPAIAILWFDMSIKLTPVTFLAMLTGLRRLITTKRNLVGHP